MLPVGALRQCDRPGNWTRFTLAEQRTMMTLWCMMRSPLIIGGEMTKNDDFTLDLLTKQEILGILRTTWCAHPLRTTEDESVWIAPRRDGKGLYIALFNLSDKKRTITAGADEAELPAFTGTELWSGKGTRKAKQLRAVLPPHDAAVWKIE